MGRLKKKQKQFHTKQVITHTFLGIHKLPRIRFAGQCTREINRQFNLLPFL